MDKVSGRLTVFFEEPFWRGVFERISEGKLSVCKVTFGAEPKDYEIYEFVLRNYYRLKFSPAVVTDVKEAGRNPKRVQREVRKQVQNIGIGTKSQQALKLQQEQLKAGRKTMSREKREVEKQRKFELKQQKRKEKHTEKKKHRYLIKQLKNISKLKVIKGNKNLMRISSSENKYNKILLKKIVTDILEREQNLTDDENIIDIEDSE